MVLDGVPIPRAEVEDFLPYLRRISPTTGRNSTLRYLLDRHLVPLAFARAEFAAERTALRKVADALGASLGTSAGVEELRKQAQALSGFEVLEDQRRAHLPLPEARWLFADENVGRVSPVLETDQGFSIVAATDKTPGLTTAYDAVDCIVVRFYTHKSKTHGRWLAALRRRLGGLPAEKRDVHADYVDAVPHWPRPKGKPANK